MDSLDNIGVSTYTLLKDAIQEGKNELAKDLADYLYFWERKPEFDLWCGFGEFVRVYYGEYAEGEFVREWVTRAGAWGPPPPEKPTMKKPEIFPRSL